MSVTPHSRTHLHAPQDIGAKLTRVVVRTLGSWRYIVIQTTFLVIWDGLNLAGILHADPWPLIFTNLMLSLQAAYASPLILMASNEAASRDRQRDDLEASEIEQQGEMQKDILGMQQDMLTMQQEQLEILRLLRVLVKEDQS